MSFFGLHRLGYQKPLGAKRIIRDLGAQMGDQGCRSAGTPKLPPITPRDEDRSQHQGSLDVYKRLVRKRQLKNFPNQVFRIPVTEGQNCSFWWKQDTGGRWERAGVGWAYTPAHPLIGSPITRFVDHMQLTDRTSYLF
ncbi:testis-expressed protein 49 [Tachyglossus aculeatus]|uniref:testis-expressed protein 49 n=1 Tax=Tachyglossus aculeatus TaxID=9261 RepID=UPI0018F56A85|nr:testis-expressed protein 49 [Tachyglossus aculeatus]